MKHKLTLTFYSPVHIGSGDQLEPFDYVVRDNRLYTFSFEAFVASLTHGDRAKLISLQKERKETVLKDIRNFIAHRIPPGLLSEAAAITPAAAGIYKNKFLDEQNNINMDPFIKTMGCPYVPGSSIKGALRTAVLNYWVEDRHKDEFHILNAKFQDKEGKWKPDITRDVFKYLKVPDIMLSKGITVFSSITNYKLKEKEKELEETGIQNIKEVTRSVCDAPGGNGEEGCGCQCECECVVQVDEEIMQDRKAKTGRRDLTFDTLWKSLDFYEKRLNLDMEKWSSLNGNLKSFYDGFKAYLEKEREKREVKVLRFGYGSGVEAVTIEKIRDTKVKYGKSINLCEGRFPLGWVVLER